MAKTCFSPSESRSLDSALPALSYRGDGECSRVDENPLDHRFLSQQESERLGDQAREPVDLAVGRPSQEVLHRRPRPRRELDDPGPVLLGELPLDITLKQLCQLVLTLFLLHLQGFDLRFKALVFTLQVGIVLGRGLELLDDLADLFILGCRLDPSLQVIETLAEASVRLDQGFRFPLELLDPVAAQVVELGVGRLGEREPRLGTHGRLPLPAVTLEIRLHQLDHPGGWPWPGEASRGEARRARPADRPRSPPGPRAAPASPGAPPASRVPEPWPGAAPPAASFRSCASVSPARVSSSFFRPSLTWRSSQYLPPAAMNFHSAVC